MFANDIRMLYTQLKACYYKEFNDYLIRDDTYITYGNKCSTPKLEILEFYHRNHYHRLDEIDSAYQMQLAKRVDSAYIKFNYFGWSDKQVRNM